MATPSTDSLDTEDIAIQYLDHIQKWCIKQKKQRRRATPDARPPHAFDELQAQAVLECARNDLPEKEFNALVSVVEHYRSSSRVGGTHSERLPATAWSMYYIKCVLCDDTRRRHFRGGKCTGCWRATHELRSRVVSLQRVSADNPTIEET